MALKSGSSDEDLKTSTLSYLETKKFGGSTTVREPCRYSVIILVDGGTPEVGKYYDNSNREPNEEPP